MNSVEEEAPTVKMDSNDRIPRSTQQIDGFVTTEKECFELKIGKKVNGEKEAYDIYNGYAFNKGFSIRRDDKTFKRGTKEVIRRTFVCSREGFREFSDHSEEKKCNRLDSRCGCKARVIFKVENGVYEISQLVAEHNHPLVESSQRHLIRSARKIHDTSKGVIKSMVDVGIRVSKTYAYVLNEGGGYKSVGYTETDCHNFIQVERSKRIAAGDGQSVVNHFKHNQLENPMFFYTVQVDEENRMSNFFWRDGISKLDYECFGDVVVFDTTYRTNKYNMICAPFVGVNHHWKNVLFGCAFLSDETTTSFVWLFNSSRDCAILKHACKVYTHKMFDKFQDEFNQTTSISVLRCMSNGTFLTYTMKRQGGNREYIVEFNPSDRSISCCCKRFESLGLLCRHALRVFNLNDVYEIPEKYILKRWTKDAKQGYGMMERHANLAQDKCGSSAKTLRLNRLMRKTFALMNLCANLEATTEIAERNMDRTFEEARKYNASLCGGDTNDVGDTSIPVSDVPMMDPPRRRTKGQTNGRIKGALEKRRKRKTPGNVLNSNPTPGMAKYVFRLYKVRFVCIIFGM